MASSSGQFLYQAHLIPSDGGIDDLFGYSIAISGDFIVAGAPWHDEGLAPYQGAAYVFTRQTTGWAQQAELTADNGGDSDFFGDAVAIDGSTVVVGAPYNNHSGSGDQEGSAYIFTRSGSSWTQQAWLVASDAQHRADFGRTVAISGDTVAVGADEQTVDGSICQGKVYIFRGSGSTWVQEADLTSSTESFFGSVIALYNDTLVVGAPTHDVGANSNQGVAYVYTRNGTTWTLRAMLTASDGATEDRFGSAVGVFGDTIAVGAAYQNADLSDQSGAIYLFEKPAGGWSPVGETAKLRASDAQTDDAFGSSLALNGNRLAAGNAASNQAQGAVYVFDRPDTGWQNSTETQKLVAPDGASNDQFGSSIGVSGDLVVSGARSDTVNTIPGMGSGYVFGRADHQLFVPCIRQP